MVATAADAMVVSFGGTLLIIVFVFGLLNSPYPPPPIINAIIMIYTDVESSIVVSINMAIVASPIPSAESF